MYDDCGREAAEEAEERSKKDLGPKGGRVE